MTAGKPVPDAVGPGLDVLFCGVNPSRCRAEVGHHFARPGNRFWPALHLAALHLAGLTPRRLTPDEDAELLACGLGVTNLVDRPTRTAAELGRAELPVGGVDTWVAPNPGGRGAHHQLPDLARRYAQLRPDRA